MQKLLGFFAWAFQFKRDLFWFFHHTYRWIEGLPQRGLVRVPPWCLDELASAALHLPFAGDLRRPLAEEVLAVDATPVAAGACRVPLPGPLRRALYRRAELRGEHARLDGAPWVSDETSRLIARDRDVDALADCLPWRVVSAYRFRESAHINLQEARSIRNEIRSTATLGAL